MQLQYSSDETAHAVVIDGPGATRRLVGGPGNGAGEFRYPRGLEVVAAETPDQTRVYVCDAWNHRVQVLDGEGRFCLAFGGLGRGPGQFDVPSDVCVVRPSFAGETLAEGSADSALLAVADRWNSRIQIFTLDGILVGAVGRRGRLIGRERVGVCNVSRAGWPYFHTGVQPALWFPTRLAWREPWLDVTCPGGRVVSIDLAAALLPDVDTFLATATEVELRQARDHVRSLPGDAMLEPAVLARLDAAVSATEVPLRMAS